MKTWKLISKPVTKVRDGWKCDYYGAGSSDKLSSSNFLFSQYVKEIDFDSSDPAK